MYVCVGVYEYSYVYVICMLMCLRAISDDTVAERLRRSTRNRLGLSRVGSSPASVDSFAARRDGIYFFELLTLILFESR